MARILAFAVLASLVLPARADEFWLENDVKIDGLIASETAERLELRISAEGTMVLDRDELVRVVPSDAKAREALVARWSREAAERREQERAERAFEAFQKSKGLILVDDRWISKDEYERRLDERRLEVERERLEVEREAASRPIVVNVQPASSVAITVRGVVKGPPPRPGAHAPHPGSLYVPSGLHEAHPGALFVNLNDPYPFR